MARRPKDIFRQVFIAVHKPGPFTVLAMLASAGLLFFLAYAVGNWT